jgi:anti-anti-sigma factor
VPDVEETTSGANPSDQGNGADAAEPALTHVVEGDTARVSVAGELTEAARRPLVRLLTDLLLSARSLRRLELDLRRVTFVNSAGLSVLVQVQRLVAGHGIEPVLVAPSAVVRGPLMLSGLWHRFGLADDEPGPGS